ncbi:hypothetical protein EYC80_001057 [Monilinia laxa]|uniref:Uncharacterized protein n=1 Tax=Monilinia laxa TaxID=61186 RepID=A0A5N6K7X8_MONLA|nr:hypothetical protein EYC80_001057 [Monilinia laxa]
MASQAPPSGPGRGISQLYPTASVPGMKSQTSPADAPTHGASQLYPSTSSRSQAPRASSKAPSVAPSPPHHPSVRSPQAATISSPLNQPSARLSEAPYHQPTVRISHAVTLRGQSQVPPAHVSSRSPMASQYATASSQVPGREPSRRTNTGATELRRDATAKQQSLLPPTIALSPPTDAKTLLQRDHDTTSQRPSANHTLLRRDQSNTHQTLLQRDRSKMPFVMTAIKEASVAPIIGPSKKFQNAPSVRSILHSPNDIKMASCQATITQLQGPERKAQEEWALGKLGKLNTGCPQNYGWSRRGDGYICDGGSHYITDLLLTEGMGGMYVVKDKHDWQNRTEGPYYWAGRNEQGKNLFMKVASPEMV